MTYYTARQFGDDVWIEDETQQRVITVHLAAGSDAADCFALAEHLAKQMSFMRMWGGD